MIVVGGWFERAARRATHNASPRTSRIVLNMRRPRHAQVSRSRFLFLTVNNCIVSDDSEQTEVIEITPLGRRSHSLRNLLHVMRSAQQARVERPWKLGLEMCGRSKALPTYHSTFNQCRNLRNDLHCRLGSNERSCSCIAFEYPFTNEVEAKNLVSQHSGHIVDMCIVVRLLLTDAPVISVRFLMYKGASAAMISHSSS